MADIVVIGGGAAGLMAGISAARAGASVVVVEKMPLPGRKLMITGKGRCNLTNSCSIKEMIKNIPGNGNFLYGALNRFSNEDLQAMLEEAGLELKEERGGRIFPAQGKAQAVLDTLLRLLKMAGGRLITGAQVTDIVKKFNRFTGVKYRKVINDGRKEGQDFRNTFTGKKRLGPEMTLNADAIIVCTGGASYPGTGSDGEFHEVLAKKGVDVTELFPALVPLVPEEGFTEDLSGLALKNIAVSLLHEGKKVASEFGELRFERGLVDGPAVLTISRNAGELMAKGAEDLELHLDLKPALDEQKLDARLQRDFASYSKLDLKGVMRKLLPAQLVDPVIDSAFLDPKKAVNTVTKEERYALVHAVKNFLLPIAGTAPIAAGIVTAGGVNLKSVDPKSMKYKKFRNLFFAGEILDIDGYTGGYNLQAAFSTGFVAGKAAAEESEEA